MVDVGSRPLLALRADCANCFGLCCVALQFERSVDFAFDKAAGDPCVNLEDDFRCGIHARLRDSGFKGCTVYDCFGAGQRVAQETYDGVSWRSAPASAADMYAVFPIVRQLHEMLWYLAEALELADRELADPELSDRELADPELSDRELADPELFAAEPATLTDLRPALRDAFVRVDRLAGGVASEIREMDVASERSQVGRLLDEVSDRVREAARSTGSPLPRRVVPGADLIGAKLPDADLRGANLRGAYLIAADLSGADLSAADLLGADLRDANVAGANLCSALFLTQFQVNGARGDAGTALPGRLARPEHWAG
jgi:Pentapeptide repeats (8 copies)